MDFQSPKILIPAALFALLSPGLILSLPSLKLATGNTSLSTVVIHGLVLALLYWGIVQAGLLKASITKADLFVPMMLFILLSPGVLLELPPGSFFTGHTNTAAVAVHTVVFAIVFGLLRSKFPQYY
jgi:hypothetical protein